MDQRGHLRTVLRDDRCWCSSSGCTCTSDAFAFIRSSGAVPREQMVRPREACRQLSPPAVSNPSDNLKNLFEMPVLFYAIVLYLTRPLQVDGVYLGAAWVFASVRALHSAVHCTVNIVKPALRPVPRVVDRVLVHVRARAGTPRVMDCRLIVVRVFVRDWPRALAFYRDTLGRAWRSRARRWAGRSSTPAQDRWPTRRPRRIQGLMAGDARARGRGGRRRGGPGWPLPRCIALGRGPGRDLRGAARSWRRLPPAARAHAVGRRAGALPRSRRQCAHPDRLAEEPLRSNRHEARPAGRPDLRPRLRPDSRRHARRSDRPDSVELERGHGRGPRAVRDRVAARGPALDPARLLQLRGRALRAVAPLGAGRARGGRSRAGPRSGSSTPRCACESATRSTISPRRRWPRVRSATRTSACALRSDSRRDCALPFDSRAST